MRPWNLCLLLVFGAWIFSFRFFVCLLQVLTVSLGHLADHFRWFCFWGSRNFLNCQLSVSVRRTTCAFISTDYVLMDFLQAVHSPTRDSPSLGSCVVVCPVLSSCWSLPGPQFKFDHHPDGWTFQPRSFVAKKTSFAVPNPSGSFRFGSSGLLCRIWTTCDVWFITLFDSTLGYPGEGPPPTNMTLVSANVGSVMTDVSWKSWNADVICLQETRVGKNNVRTATKTFQGVGFTPCFGELLPGLWSGSKSTKTPPGGTLIAGGSPYVLPFDPLLDVTGLYAKLYQTKRVVAAWVQVTPRKRALVLSVYATTSASQDPKIHAMNDELFNDIFTFVAQFGRIPIVVAGDLQAPPMSYPAVATAISFQSWHDPVAVIDDFGEAVRPLTFSNDGSFSGIGEGCTSIDSVLVNDIAFAALVKAEVLEIFGKQHRPIRLEFDWPSINLIGYHLLKAAPLVFDGVTDPLDPPTEISWELPHKQQFDAASSPDDKWTVVNDFLTAALVAKGASWGDGPRERGKAPTFVPRVIAPKQMKGHCAASMKGILLARLLGRLNELFIRLSRCEGSAQDVYITQRTADKALTQLIDLSAPVVWVKNRMPTLLQVHFAIQWVTSNIKTHEFRLKVSRIKRWKDRIRHSATHGRAYIFHHLKNKQQEEPANLVVDQDHNIVYQPNAALTFLNSEWDQVFSANVLQHHPLKMLETVWPYIHDKQVQAQVAPITGTDLHKIIQKRKPTAAPGLDGWRTTELQRLTPAELQPCAEFFALIEETDIALPTPLVCAKQVILNKPGPTTALNKRLIAILPAILLAYTGARFAQLQTWQQEVMPPSILGGIKGRFMSDLYNQLRLDIDEAALQGDTLIGIKLDKAKAFDRVVPKFVAALFLAFGIPSGIVSFFVKMYDGLHRHLSYRNWISDTATTAANGVCQGCSMSLLAINVYNKVWCHLLDHLPEILIRAYIDDSYLWCKLQQVATLQKAIEVTKIWDLLSGQKLNEGKSSVWGTSSNARKQLKTAFSGFPIVLELDVLGTKVYTSERQQFQFSEKKLKKVLADIDNIAALPVGRATRSFLIGAKIIPQVSFGSHISKIPQQAMRTMQNAVARALWAGQPMWRSKQLLQCILSQPHRTDPYFATAYLTIIETVRLCWCNNDACTKLLRTWTTGTGNHSLANSLRAAFDMLGIDTDEHLGISFANSPFVSLFSLSPSCISKTLQNIVRNACYWSINPKSRKDFAKPSGIFDFQQTTLLLRSRSWKEHSNRERFLRLENILVGCTLTNDRLASSGWVTNANCRFCDNAKESMPHLIHCTKVHAILGKPVLHEFGSNFAVLGHVQHPISIAKKRLQMSDISSIGLASTFSAEHNERMWTDGSVIHSNTFWITNAAYAVLDETRQIRFKGLVQHWNVSAYCAELWAILVTCARACFTTCIYCDCSSVVEQATLIFQGEMPAKHWKYFHWWSFLAHVVKLRQSVVQRPFHIQWIPAHCYEQIPIELLSEDLARLKNTTVEHIHHNRLVDIAARDLAVSTAPVHTSIQQQVAGAVSGHQQWLVDLHALLPTEQPDRAVVIKGDEAPQLPDLQACRKRFPQWLWGTKETMFPWKPKIPHGVACPVKWSSTTQNWETCCAFLRSTTWLVDSKQDYSFNELAVLLHTRGFSLHFAHEEATYLDVYKLVREALSFLNSDPSADPHPGKFHTSKPRCCGRVLPQGSIQGAIPFVTDEERVAIGQLFHIGAGRALASWDIPLA